MEGDREGEYVCGGKSEMNPKAKFLVVSFQFLKTRFACEKGEDS